MNWQPIETAPKDEDVDVLGYCPNDDHLIVTMYLSLGKWTLAGSTSCYTCGGGTYDPKPTNWMPLPPPPTE